jgi:hypothetical protein
MDASSHRSLQRWMLMPRKSLQDKVKMCNCARCGQALLGLDMMASKRLGDYANLPFVGGRRRGRPYCRACFMMFPKSSSASTVAEGLPSSPLSHAL